MDRSREIKNWDPVRSAKFQYSLSNSFNIYRIPITTCVVQHTCAAAYLKYVKGCNDHDQSRGEKNKIVELFASALLVVVGMSLRGDNY